MKNKTQDSPLHLRARGLFLLVANILIFFSLVSFSLDEPSRNLLGSLGYFFAWILNYFFGLGSFLLISYFSWVSWRWIIEKKIPHFFLKTSFFSLFLFSACLLLNVLSDSFPTFASLFGNKVYNEQVFFSDPYPHIYIRHNLGGVPLYFLYRDLPFFPLQRILSSVGTVLIFSFAALASFLVLTGTAIGPKIDSLLLRLRFFAVKFKKLSLGSQEPLPSKETLSYEKEASKTPILEKSKEEKSSSLEKRFSSVMEKEFPQQEKTPSPLPFFFKEKEPKTFSPGYQLPPLSLLTSPPKGNSPVLKKELKKQAQILEETLASFGIEAKVGEIHSGPTIVSFEVHPAIGVKVQKIKALENDIALNLEAKSIRIIAPIPGKAAVGVEIPSPYPQEVSLKEMILHYQQMRRRFSIPLLLGKTVSGEEVLSDLAKMPHCLIAGATGSGKSVCINSIVMSILFTAHPNDIKLLMIDPKKVELTQYSELPHMIAPVITESHGAYAALQWLVREMQLRYEILKQLGLRNITAFNSRKINRELEASLSVPIPENMPLIVAIIDEFADLMMASSSDLETPIARIAQMARAVGIHLILATQRPSREVITGIIKANFSCRIAFKVASRINSQIILDETGAESLLGNGDLLFLPPGSSHLLRAQGALIRDEDIHRTVTFLRNQSPPSYLIPSFDKLHSLQEEDSFRQGNDKLYEQALLIVLETKNASTTFLQRKLKIGYARAASLMDELEEKGIIGPQEGSKPRRILVSSDKNE